MLKYFRRKLNEYIITEVDKRLSQYITEEQQVVERIRIIDLCMAMIVSSNLRLDTLILELRRFESLPSLDELERRTKENISSHFEEVMRRQDLIRQELANEVIAYRRRNPPPVF